ncbi:MAG: hypothetical protein M4579_001497 [Chaenotheca gracillima]|nr:MAG: hypothetical protein M4579_001497 [Chaenotheca gracillima]
MAGDTIKTRLLIISDTHTAIPEIENAVSASPGRDAAIAGKLRWPWQRDSSEDDNPLCTKRSSQATGQHAYRHPLPKADVLLHAGDLTMVGKPEEYKKVLSFLKSVDAELKLVIAGNHDITLDREFFEEYGSWGKSPEFPVDLDEVREMWTGEDARSHGIVYLEQGTRTFTLKSGAKFTIFTSPYQPEFYNWAFAYEREEDVYNPSCLSSRNPPLPTVPSFPEIDLMMTHGPPLKRLDRTRMDEPVGCEHLLKAVERARPRLHCFGHIHEGWGAERLQWKSKDHQETRLFETDAEEEIESVESIKVDMEKAVCERAVKVDISQSSGKPLEFGKETLFVNAAIMDVRYMPVNAPWLIDLDLPKAKSTSSST